MSTSLISCRDVALDLGGRRVLHDIDLDILPGEIVSLIGPNGAGKSSLLRVLMGIYAPTAGIVTRHTDRIGYVPQRITIDRTLPLSVVDFVRIYSGADRSTIETRLGSLGMSTLRHARIGTLSGGELQRTLIVLALLRTPDILLLDEPTSGVDVLGEETFYALIDDIHRDTGVAIILVSHDIHTVFARSSRILCLDGHICCSGHPTDLAGHAEIRRLFGEHIVPYTHHHDHTHEHHR